MTIALTGHRPDKLGGEYDGIGPVSGWLRARLTALIHKLKPTMGISGMALGADTIWAEQLIMMSIPFTAAVPFAGQELKWPKVSQDRYHALLTRAQTVYTVSPGRWNPRKMQVRNEWMVDHADKLIVVSDGSAGGTMNCLNYARSKWGLDIADRIIIINPEIARAQQLIK